jgi:hypothetical protein
VTGHWEEIHAFWPLALSGNASVPWRGPPDRRPELGQGAASIGFGLVGFCSIQWAFYNSLRALPRPNFNIESANFQTNVQ